MAATLTAAVASEVTTNTTSYASGSFTPAAGDLLVVLVLASDTVAAGTVSNSEGLTFTKVTSALKNSSADTLYVFVADSASNGNAQTCTFDCTGDAATGCAIAVLRIAGMAKFGASAVRQSAKQENQAAGTPAPAFSVAALTSNPCLCFMGNSTNTATMTRPDSNWTEQRDNGFNTPTTGYEYCTRPSGFTGTTITWGSASATAFGAIIVEFDFSITGSLSKTLDALTSASAGTLAIVGSETSTLGALTLAGTGALQVTGSLNAPLDALTASGAGEFPNTGAVDATLGSLTLASAATLAITGAVDATLGSLTTDSGSTVTAERGGGRVGRLKFQPYTAAYVPSLPSASKLRRKREEEELLLLTIMR